ncbi:potassium-transporting ATPase subunit KdpA [Daejeonella oryzae]|uniref:potassium-transporting ATPase subunit KdpA n=1 Tax=Daejeonella oryzae TaxID=1122943 RepID=UPI0004174C35|nr:potassium-transporting ATPase subunit KdpA [Daejeonella oryzae]
MNTEILSVGLTFLVTILPAIPLGRYISKVYKGEKTLLDPVLNPLDKLIFKSTGLDANREMNWKQHLYALLTVNMVWFFVAMFLLMNQGWLPLNPDSNPSMSPHLAFNTAISFLVNCNLQHYSGETGMSYLSQILFVTFLQFVSAATGLAAAAMVFNALKERTTEKLGNFYNNFVKSLTRILLPVSIVVALILAFNGTPMNFQGKDQFISVQGDTVNVSRGPAAAMIAIKHVGTNGGGYFGVNSSHPLENPNYLTNVTEIIAQMIIPLAMVFAIGFYLKRKKLSWMIFGVMTLGFLMLVIPTIYSEIQGNPQIQQMGVDQRAGAMEGKETHIGAAASAYWSIATTVISTGSVNSMHDSSMPISGMMQLLAMMTNAFYGGVGVGILNFYVFIIIAVFISGLMVGRTPEFMGKKIEAREIKIAMIVALFHPFLILVGTALSAYGITNLKDIAWLNNPGFHGFSEMLYEFTSSAANNGSGFEGLGDNTPWWNISTGIVLILGRFIPIIGPLAIAGLLATKKSIPESAGTLKTDTTTFGVMIFAVIFIITALSFFPALTLGPIAEYFSIY